MSKKNTLRRALLSTMLSIGMICFVGIGFAAWRPVVSLFNQFETTPPVISATELPIGIGLMPSSFNLSVIEDNSYLADISVELSHNNKTVTLYPVPAQNISSDVTTNITTNKGASAAPEATGNTNVSSSTHNAMATTALKTFNQKIIIPPVFRTAKNTQATLRITATNTSFWGNKATFEHSILIDSEPPRIEVLTRSNNTTLGGVSLSFVKLTGDVKEAFFKVEDNIYPIFQAKHLDPFFNGHEDIYFGFFALPFSLSNTKPTVTVMATDGVDNEGKATIIPRVKQRKQSEEKINLSESFINTKVPELWDNFQAYVQEHDGNKTLPLLAGKVEALANLSGNDLLLQQFKIINEDYRALLSLQLSQIMSKTSQEMLWDGAFIKPLGAKTTARYSEKRTYMFKNNPISNSIHDGLDLADTEKAPVKAANSGVVVYAGDLGIYGQTVVIDHGFSLFSIYGHLSLIDIASGQKIAKGETLGRTGTTGLAGGDHLHFELRLRDTPVTAVEWWDALWIQDHVMEKIREIKESFQETTQNTGQISGQEIGQYTDQSGGQVKVN